MNNYKVLIIENDADNISEFQTPLQHYGYQVMSLVQNMSKVKSKIKTFFPDIVIVNSTEDIQKTIIWAKYIIREELPCIICVNNIDKDMIEKISHMQACALFIKPFNLLNIHVTIQMSLDKFKKEEHRKENENSLKTDNQNLRQLLFGEKITENPMVCFGKGFYFHTGRCETYYKNKRVLLTKKENLFIQLLVSNLGHTISFEQAINYIWGQPRISENNVRTLVWRLRSKLQSDIIKTVSGVGYYVEETYISFQNKSEETVLIYNKQMKDSA
ncbi:MAG: winged helix-turn-helix domain-containing protein [Thiovulaceae bacterium]|nr:winged helix-turn-helix domain-containing protein [Sulfurimonadaceae bacterium]